MNASSAVHGSSVVATGNGAGSHSRGHIVLQDVDGSKWLIQHRGDKDSRRDRDLTFFYYDSLTKRWKVPVTIDEKTGNVGIGVTNPSEALVVLGNVSVTGSVVQHSDARLKTDVQPVSGALDKISRLRGVSYRWKQRHDEKKHIGLIAQEVETVLPELVHTDSKGMKSVAYNEMVSVLIESTKALKARIEALEAQLEESKSRASSARLVLEIGSPFRVFCDRRECPGEILQDHPHQGLKIVSERRSFPATRVVRHVKAPKMHRVTTKAKVLDGIALWSRLDDDRNAMFTGAEMLGARGV